MYCNLISSVELCSLNVKILHVYVLIFSIVCEIFVKMQYGNRFKIVFWCCGASLGHVLRPTHPAVVSASAVFVSRYEMPITAPHSGAVQNFYMKIENDVVSAMTSGRNGARDVWCRLEITICLCVCVCVYVCVWKRGERWLHGSAMETDEHTCTAASVSCGLSQTFCMWSV